MASKATRYERQKAREHGAKHVGGPGRPDYTRGVVKGEVKDRKTPVTGPELKRLASKGVKEVDSKGGFTGPAIAFGKQKAIKLISRKRVVR